MKKPSRRTLFLIAICVFLFAVNASLGFALTKQSSAAMRSLIESRMLDVSNTAAALLDGDTLQALEAEDAGTPEYQGVLRMLTSFKENIALEYIYCVRDMGDGSFVFMIDPDPDDPGEFGEHIPYTDALYQASQGTPAVDKVPYEDDWGRFYSAYSPVFGSDGRVAGIVAVDFSASWYDDQVSQQVRTTFLVTGISLFFGAVIILLISTRFRKRFHRMIGEMNVVSNGIETLVHEVSPDIEINLHRDVEQSPSDDEIAELGDRIRSLEDQLSEQIAFVRSQAYVDGLTGLGNRTAYEDRVRKLDDDIRSGRADFAIAVFDLNGLKEINDRCGHEQGDRSIQQVAAALKRIFDGENVYRIGGDEFIAVLEGGCADLGDRLRGVARQLGDSEIISVSKGQAAFDRETDIAYRDVFNRADSAMYDDKREYYLTHEDRRRKYSNESGPSVDV